MSAPAAGSRPAGSRPSGARPSGSAVAAVLGATAVAAGAFGAHALDGHVTAARLGTWEVAARYQLVHAVVLLILALSPYAVATALSARVIAAGTGIFAGSLYLLVLLDQPWLGAVTPIGGLLLIGGWASLLWTLRGPRA